LATAGAGWLAGWQAIAGWLATGWPGWLHWPAGCQAGWASLAGAAVGISIIITE